jgi:hypothetical protein
MKGFITILIGLLALIMLFGGCASSSPIQYTNRQVYMGILTDINLVPNGYPSTPGTVTLDNSTIVFGYFLNVKGEALQDLTLGATYRIAKLR